MQLDWIQYALEKLTIDEFAIALHKMQETFNMGGRIVSVVRQGKKAIVGVKLNNGLTRTVTI